jgi:hypothetical protein
LRDGSRGACCRVHVGETRKALDLGGVRQFHLGLNISRQVSDHARIGVALTHISNAGSQRINPGVNSGLVTFTWMFQDY